MPEDGIMTGTVTYEFVGVPWEVEARVVEEPVVVPLPEPVTPKPSRDWEVWTIATLVGLIVVAVLVRVAGWWG
jgi:hypothetical protein